MIGELLFEGPAEDPDSTRSEAVENSIGGDAELFFGEIGAIEDIHGANDVAGTGGDVEQRSADKPETSVFAHHRGGLRVDAGKAANSVTGTGRCVRPAFGEIEVPKTPSGPGGNEALGDIAADFGMEDRYDERRAYVLQCRAIDFGDVASAVSEGQFE